MPDIVERLRNYDYRGNRPPEHAVMAEAADEIERLHALIAELRGAPADQRPEGDSNG